MSGEDFELDPSDGANQDSAATEDVDEGSDLTWNAIKAVMPPAIVGVLTALKVFFDEERLGIVFTDDPIGYFQALVKELLINSVLGVFGFIGLKIEQGWRLFTGVLEDGGGAVYDSFASVGGSFLGVITGVETTLGDLAGSSPFGMLIALGIWIAIAFASIYVAIQTWNAIKRLIPWLIPWL